MPIVLKIIPKAQAVVPCAFCAVVVVSTAVLTSCAAPTATATNRRLHATSLDFVVRRICSPLVLLLCLRSKPVLTFTLCAQQGMNMCRKLSEPLKKLEDKTSLTRAIVQSMSTIKLMYIFDNLQSSFFNIQAIDTSPGLPSCPTT
jgi:hypothetical protein